MARIAFVALFVAFFDPSDPGVAATDVQYVRRVIVGDTFSRQWRTFAVDGRGHTRNEAIECAGAILRQRKPAPSPSA